mmetsp:Transcript_61702/g.191080  ORF Transcript_61702/g.191080 Transcript_61702/m.191080 type:complete len:485 (-) Transcript_61702:2798-4252(-)
MSDRSCHAHACSMHAGTPIALHVRERPSLRLVKRDVPRPRTRCPAVVHQQHGQQVIARLVGGVAQRLVDVGHALVHCNVPHVAVAEDVQFAPQATEKVVYPLAARALGGLVARRERQGQLPAWQEVRERYDGAVERQTQEALIQLKHVLPDLVVRIHRPPGLRVHLVVGVRPGILQVEVRVVPGVKRHDEDILRNSVCDNVHAQLVAHVHDGVELGDGVRVLLDLRRVDPHLVVAGSEEHAAELCLQGPQRSNQGVQSIGHIACHDQNVLLEHELIDVVHPLVVLLVVEVEVGHHVHLGGCLRPAHVHAEARPQPRHCGDGPPEGHEREASLPGALQLLVVRAELQALGKRGVGLLVLSHAEQRRAEAVVCLGVCVARQHGSATVRHSSIPIAHARKGKGPVGEEDGVQNPVGILPGLDVRHQSGRARVVRNCKPFVGHLHGFVALGLLLVGFVDAPVVVCPRDLEESVNVVPHWLVLHRLEKR